MDEAGGTVRVGADGRAVATLVGDGARPTLVWLGGFRSDMTGTKAEALAAFGRSTGRRVVRFDYSGHGASPGAFEDGTIGRWAEEAAAVVETLAPGRVVLVGSSMGGWIALLVALGLRRSGRGGDLAGLVLLAPAPDFTERLMWDAFDEETRARLLAEGRVALPGAYSDDPTIVTRGLIEDGRRHILLDGPVGLDAPLRILQGMEDADVPWRHAELLLERYAGRDAVLTLVRDGDHRLSRPADVARMLAMVAELAS